MIEKLTLKGFQNHEDKTIEFDPQITCIVGQNDIGKSAILRALYWLAFNKPSGEAFKNWESSKVSAKLKVDGRTIIRRKGKQNLYILDGEKYKAFKTGVPDEIAKLLNLSAVNFQHQKEPPFWLALSPQQVSKELNKIVDLQVIDTSLANVAVGLRKAKVKTELIEDRLKEAKKKKKELKWVKGAHDKLLKIERTHDRIDVLTEKARQLLTYIDNVSCVERELKGLAKLAVRAQKLNDSSQRLQKLILKQDRLKELASDIKQKEDEICQNKKSLQKISNALAKVKVCPLCGARRTQS